MKSLYFIGTLLLFTACNKTNRVVTKITAKTIEIDSTLPSSKKIDSVIAPYKKRLTTEMEEVLSFAPKDFTKKNIDMQSTLGNLMADMCFKIANPVFKEKTNTTIDFAMFNNGGLRAQINAGDVTQENAFNLMPFENEFVVVQLSGDQIIDLVHYIMNNKTAHPLSNHIKLTINKETFTLKINGENFDKNKTYNVLTSDYLQGGGDRMDFFKNPLKLTKLDYKIRDAIINYFKKVDTLQPVIDQRITLE